MSSWEVCYSFEIVDSVIPSSFLKLDVSFINRLFSQFKAYSMRLFTLFLLLSTSYTSFGQEGHNSSHFEVGIAFKQQNQWDSAIFFLNKAKEESKSANDTDGYFRSWLEAAQCLTFVGNFEIAEQENLFILEELIQKVDSGSFFEANVYKNLGEIYAKKNEALKATGYLLKSEKLFQKHPDRYDLKYKTFLENNLGVMYARRGYYDLSATYLEQALHHYLLDTNVNQAGISATYNNLGNLNYLLGNDRKAIEMFEESISIKKMINPNNHRLSTTYNNIANLLRNNGQYHSAIRYLKEALKINEQFPEKADWQVPGTLATTYSSLGEHDLAIKYLKIHEQDVLSRFGPLSLEISKVYSIFGQYYFENQEYRKSSSYFKKTIKILESINQDVFEDLVLANQYVGLCKIEEREKEVGLNYIKLATDILKEKGLSKSLNATDLYSFVGNSLLEIQAFDDAKNYLQLAIQANLRTLWDVRNPDLPIDKGFFHGGLLVQTIADYARLLALTSKNEKDLSTSLQFYHYGDSLISKLQKRGGDFTDKLRFRTEIDDFYKNAIATCYQMYESSKDEGLVSKAHYFFERNRNSLALLELSEAQARVSISIPDSILEKETELTSLRAYHKSKIYDLLENNNEDEERLSYHEKTLFEVERKIDRLIINIDQNYPEYSKLKYNVDYASPAEIQQNLSPDECLLQYSIGESKSHVILINKERSRFVELNHAKGFQEELLEYYNMLSNPNHSQMEYQTLSYKLYKELLDPLKLDLRVNLTLIPDGTLSLIPFGTLVTEMVSTEMAYSRLPYLVNKFNVRYLLSSNNLYPDSSAHVFRGLAAFAPSFGKEQIAAIDTRSYIAPLQWTEEEIDNIATYFDGEKFKRNEANEINFKKSASNSSIIHIASHALIDVENPFFSRILLSNVKHDSIHDGILYLHEIFDMDMNAELAVLSACNTGKGKLFQGEGMISLGGGFLSAGANSVLMTQWEVDDKSTSILMDLFYKNLSEGKSKSKALQNAQLAFLETITHGRGHPHYWGAFELMGSDLPIESEKNWVLVVGLISLLLFGGILVVKSGYFTSE